MKLKVGSVVRIVEDLEGLYNYLQNNCIQNCSLDVDMLRFESKQVTISHLSSKHSDNRQIYKINEDGGDFSWDEECFELKLSFKEQVMKRLKQE